MEMVKLEGVDVSVLTKEHIGLRTLRTLADKISGGLGFATWNRKETLAYLARKGVERYAIMQGGAAQQLVYCGLGARDENGERRVIVQSAQFEPGATPRETQAERQRLRTQPIEDDCQNIAQVKANADTTLQFFRDPRTGLISIEVTDDSNARCKGWLARNVRHDTLERKFLSALRKCK